jgi:Cytochrome bd-type quinol oxidase, subunit 1
MIENLDLSMVNWARAQFALTAMYHWIFVPLTLGLSWILAFFHTIYVRTGSEEWKRLTKFWMTLFGVNFAIGVASGIIMEFEFGTNWSNYSWMVGDIFGAPLAIEGIVAFFIEATFFAVMFFGWNRVSKGFHLFSTWMVAVGSNLSAVWILVANAWMQYPVGQAFNPDTARFEMQNFFEVALSPYAINKFIHTTSSAMMLSAFFIISIASWYLLRGRHMLMAKRSIIVAASLGLVASIFTIYNGDESAYMIARVQPMKLAACEGLYEGQTNAGLMIFGYVNPEKKVYNAEPAFKGPEIKVPFLLSLMANRSLGSFVPGMKDLVYGNTEHNVQGAAQRMIHGKKAVADLDAYRQAKKDGDADAVEKYLAAFNENKEHLGYGYLNKPEEAVPPVRLSFYAFRVMILLGTLFPFIFIAYLYFACKDALAEKKWLLGLGTITYILGIVASQSGWIVAEAGRQPWAIQGLLPVTVARTNLTAGTVQTTFMMFLVLFTVLLIAEICIMVKQINIGPEEN